MIKLTVLLLAAGLLLSLPACNGCSEQKKLVKPEYEEEVEPNTVKLTMGGVPVTLEIARTNREKARGLMFRKKLPPDRGMIFIYEAPKIMSFYMRDTYIPLSIAFLRSDGKIINIEGMRPLVEEPSTMSKGMGRYAIEMNQGWFEAHGIREGDTIELTQEILAIEAEPSS
jgi:uncharacterized membrane protein (UPF0127 family)